MGALIPGGTHYIQLFATNKGTHLGNFKASWKCSYSQLSYVSKRVSPQRLIWTPKMRISLETQNNWTPPDSWTNICDIRDLYKKWQMGCKEQLYIHMLDLNGKTSTSLHHTRQQESAASASWHSLSANELQKFWEGAIIGWSLDQYKLTFQCT